MGSTLQATRKGSSIQGAVGLIALGTCLVAGLLFSPQAELTKLAYPGVALAIGLWFYATQPALYVGFTFWIWMITPFVRRVVDYNTGGFDPINPVMLAPLVVTALTGFTLFRFIGSLRQRRYFPYLLCLSGILYGYLIGIAKAGLMPATFSLLSWILPPLFGFHLFLFWKLYPRFRSVVRSAFTWGVLVLGTYGVCQYLLAPPWDMAWLEQSGMTSSMGKPEATEFRVFSTLNSVGPFAAFMMVGLLILFDGRGLAPRLAAIPGYGSFLLALVRSAWGGWVVGVALMFTRLGDYSRSRTIAILVVSVALSVPLLILAPNTEKVTSRMDTITELDEDNSMRARMQLYQGAGLNAILSPLGQGIGSLGTATKLSEAGVTTSFDSGVLAIPLVLGWLGSLLYLGGLIWMLLQTLKITTSNADTFAVIGVSIVMAFMAMMVFGNQLKGLNGMMAWSFLGLALASRHYHQTRAVPFESNS
jgi:hypothetical protein